jgi:hypothetical protein
LEGGQRRLPDDPGELLGEQSRALEVENGKRSSVNWVRNTPTATHQWHDLKVRISGIKVQGYLDGKLYLEHMLAQPVSGRIGLWSKADSHMYFSDYTVTRSN